MSFGGHAYDMNLRIRQNREMKERRRERTKDVVLSIFKMRQNRKNISLKTKEYTPKHKEEILLRLKNIKKKEVRTQIIALAVTTIIVFGAIFFILKLFVFN